MSYQPPPQGGYPPNYQPQGQPPYQGPPPQGYPQQPPPPKKRGKPWLWILIGVVIVVIALCSIIANAGKSTNTANTQSTSTASDKTTPPKAKTWQTIKTYTGNGAKKTESFTVGNSWKIQWSCQGNTEYSIDAPLYLTIYKEGSSFPLDTASTTCKATEAKTTGETELHKGGTVYIDVNAGIEWALTIQEMK